MYEDFETMQMRAWPAEEETWLGSWKARYSRGFSNRSNSVTPLGGGRRSGPALEERVQEAEAAYRSRGLRPCFRLRDDPECLDLNVSLERRGYCLIHPTAVKTVMLAEALSCLGSDAPTAARPMARFQDGFSEAWARAYAALNQRPGDAEAYWWTLAMVRVPARCLILMEGDRPVAAGSAIRDMSGDLVRAGPWVGFYDLAVDRERRGRGLGMALLGLLVEDALRQGLERGYLAVMEDNAAALGLYAKAGFKSLYRYWYRRAAD